MTRSSTCMILSILLGMLAPEHAAQTSATSSARDGKSTGTVSLRLSPPRYRLVEAQQGRHRIEMEGFETRGEAGAPLLPFKLLELEVPEAVRKESLRLRARRLGTRALGRYRIEEGAQASVGSSDELVLQQETPGSASAPAEGSSAGPFTILGLVTRWEEGRRRVFARILYDPIEVRGGDLLLSSARWIDLAYELGRARIASCPRFDYVIVTTRAIRDASESLADFVWHKESLGFSVRVITETDYGRLAGPYPNGTAERIRKWLQTNYLDMGIRYVLLIGNPEPDDPMYTQDFVGDIPMKQVWHRLAGEQSGTAVNNGFFWGDATDWYYADLTGDWDVNRDGFYGVRPWLPSQNVVKSPLPTGIPATGFSARWTGTIEVPSSTNVTLQLLDWPQGRVFVDGVLTIDHWSGTPTKASRLNSVLLTAGAHAIRVEYAQPRDHGHLRFQYQIGSTSAAWITGTFAGEYFANPNLQGAPAATVAAEELEKNWENSDYTSAGGVDLDAEVAVGRIPVFDGDVAGLDKTLQRIMGFETGYTPARRNVLVVMKPLGANTPLRDLGEAIAKDHLIPAGLNPYRIYDSAAGLTPPPEATPVNPTHVVTGWNRGVGAVFTNSHGTPRWTEGILDAALHLPPPVAGQPSVETDRPAIASFLGCHVGTPYLPDCYPGCAYDRNRNSDVRSTLATSALRETAVAVIASTEVSSGSGGAFSPNSLRRYDQDLAYLYSREIARNETVGDAMRRVHYTHFSANVDNPTTYHQQLIHVLYGDPSVRLIPKCTINGLPCAYADLRSSWRIPSSDRPIVWDNFVPKICQYVMDCPACTTEGYCPFSATIELPAVVTLEARDSLGRVVASSPLGSVHRLQFPHDPSKRYRLIVSNPQAAPGTPGELVRGIRSARSSTE